MEFPEGEISWEPFGGPWVFLIVIGLGSMILSFCIPSTNPWAAGIGTSSIVSWIAFSLIDSRIRQRERRDKNKRREVALKELEWTVNYHLILLREWYRAALPIHSGSESSNLKKSSNKIS